MTTLGKTSNGTGSSASSSNKAIVSQFTAVSSGVLTVGHARLWIDSGTTTCRCVVYANSGGVPGALLASSDDVTVSNTTEAVVDFVFSGVNQIDIAATDYWIGVSFQDPGTQSVNYSRDATASQRLEINTYLPDPFGSGSALSGPLDVWVEHFVTVFGEATSVLGGLTATAVGNPSGAMSAPLGALTANAVGAAPVIGIAVAPLGALTALASGEVYRDRSWYIGPLGDLRALTCPEVELSTSQVRYGGIHQGLSGARTLDITGHRSEYGLELKWLDESEFYYLEAMHTRMMPGPYFLIDPLKRNRLTVQATGLVVDRSGNAGVRIPTTAGYSIIRDFPSDIPIPGRSLKIENWTGSFGRVEFDWFKKVPFRPSELAYGSLYVKADASYAGAYLQIEWFDADRIPVGTATNSTPFSITTSWSRRTLTDVAVPTGAACASLSLVLGSSSTRVYFAAPQLEAFGLTDWQVGGGAPEVIIDQLPVVSPRFPLRNVTLNLLEA